MGMHLEKCNWKFKNFLKKYWIEIGLFLIALVVMSSYGIGELPILKDLGLFYYLGQEVLRGYPLYSTAYEVKPPVPFLTFALSMSVFGFLPQYLSTRVFMLIVTSVSVLMFYRIVLKISNNKTVSVLSALILISFTFFVELWLLGDSKAMALFFCFLMFLLLFKKSYTLSGLSASMSLLFWQPFALFLIAPLIFLMLEKNGRRKKIINIFKTLLGFSIPLVVLVGYFFFFGSVKELLDFSLFYPLKYESASLLAWRPWLIFNVLGYYCSEFFFLLFGAIGLLFVICKFLLETVKKRSLSILLENKYLAAFAVSFLFFSFAVAKDFDDGSDLTVLLPIVSLLAAISLEKIKNRLVKIVSSKMGTPEAKASAAASAVLILLVCAYGFLPALQPVYPENPVITYKDLNASSPSELVARIQNDLGFYNSIFLFLFRRPGEQLTINHQLELAKMIQNSTLEDEKILSLDSPEMLFLSNRRNLNPYPLFEGTGFYEIAVERGEIDKIRSDIVTYRPKFILYSDKKFIEKLGIGEFVEKNYEELNFIYYKIYKLKG